MGLSIYFRVLATRLGWRGVPPSQRGGFVQVFTGACKHPRPWRWCPMQVLDNTWKVAPRGPLRTGFDAPRGASTRKYPEGPGGGPASGANQRQAGGKHSKIDGCPDRLSRQVRRRRQTPRTAALAAAPTTRRPHCAPTASRVRTSRSRKRTGWRCAPCCTGRRQAGQVD